MVIAENHDNAMRYDEALTYYFKCLEASKKCWDKSAEGNNCANP
jgi:hypothetical protein